MSHPDEEVLAGLALGEEVDAAHAAHVEGCPTCQALLARSRRTLDAARAPIDLVAPPAGGWDRLAALLDEPEPARRRLPAVAVAALGAAVGVAATVAVVLATRDDAPAPPVRDPAAVVAAGRVVALPADDGTTQGTARVVREGSGRDLRLVLDSVPRHGSAFVQAWMLDPTTKQMVAVGVVSHRVTTFPLPARLDLAAYSAVDLSLEPDDGDPAHSQTSLARAQLRRR